MESLLLPYTFYKGSGEKREILKGNILNFRKIKKQKKRKNLSLSKKG